MVGFSALVGLLIASSQPTLAEASVYWFDQSLFVTIYGEGADSLAAKLYDSFKSNETGEMEFCEGQGVVGSRAGPGDIIRIEIADPEDLHEFQVSTLDGATRYSIHLTGKTAENTCEFLRRTRSTNIGTNGDFPAAENIRCFSAKDNLPTCLISDLPGATTR